MGARTLEARLSARLLALIVVILGAVGVTTVLATDRALAAADEERAQGEAAGARDALAVELSEGDSREEATREVIASAEGEGVRVAVWFADGDHYGSGPATLPRMASGTCATVVDGAGAPWRACAAEGAGSVVAAAIPITVHRAAVATVWRAMGVVVVLATLLVWWGIRRALRGPLGELTSLVRWTRRVRAGGLEDQGVPATQTREIADLAGAFEVLVRDLLEGIARERANSAHIAHELRTPLTAIAAELDALASRSDATAAVATRIRADVTRLADAIDAILVLTARTHGPAVDVVNVADLAREIVPAGVAVEAPDEALVEADERLVRLAVRNLIDNAKKYGGGARLLRVSRDATGARIAVIDGGPGLDAGARTRMFDRYWRRSADGEGRGLGLALVRAVAERHGGKAEAIPGPAGQGLEVSLTLGHVVGWHEPSAVSR